MPLTGVLVIIRRTVYFQAYQLTFSGIPLTIHSIILKIN